MKYIIDFDNVKDSNRDSLWNKWYNILFLNKNNFNVPYWFFISKESFLYFIKYNNINFNSDLEKISDELLELKIISNSITNKIMNWLIGGNLKKEILFALNNINSKNWLAIRSSSTFEDWNNNSWAGQFNSYINIKADDLFDNIKKVWCSLFSVRSLYYLVNSNNKAMELQMAVVIQEYIQCNKSWVIFTKNPVNFSDEIYIEWFYWDWENVVWWKIIPYSYKINTRNWEITGDIKWWILNDNELTSLYNQAILIKDKFWFECDIEWWILNWKCYIFQVRPITILKK